MLDLFRDILTSLGAHHVLRAQGVAQGERILRGDSVDVLITELSLNPGSGFDLVELVRRSPASTNHTMPIIMTTAQADDVNVYEARDRGVTEFVAKPFTAERLYNRVISAVARPRPFINSEDYFGPDRRRRQLPYKGSERRVSEPEHVMASNVRL
jgi:DNA-binding response OmpR family regulator